MICGEAATNLTPPNPPMRPPAHVCSAYADPGVLNRAEWVKFVAVFFNKEVEANKLFSTIVTDYQKTNASARAAAGATPTKAAWISKYGDGLTLSYAVYKQEYMRVRLVCRVVGLVGFS